MSNGKSIKYSLASIRVDEFATIGKCEEIQLDGVTLQNQFNFALSLVPLEVVVSHKLIFEFADKPFIILQVSCGFGIDEKDFNEVVAPKNGIVSFPLEFMRLFSSITVGTARGILHLKLENTEFCSYMLPIIDIEEILTKDVVFILESAQKA